MGPPDTEWLLWAKRSQTEHHSLLQRFTAVEESATQIQELVQRKHGEALDQIKALTKASSALKESNLNLEKDIGVLKKIVQRTQDDIKVVTSESQKSLAELDETKKRVRGLESALDRIESDQSGGDLQKQQGVLQGQIDRLTREVNWWRSEAAAANERLENRVLRRKLYNRPVSRSLSQATTEAETVNMNDAGARAEEVLQEEIKGMAQGQLTLEEYFTYGQDLINRARKTEEDKVMRAFVAGVRDNVWRMPLQEVLNEKGWTWEETKAQMERVIAQTQKKKRTKRFIVPPEKMDAFDAFLREAL